MQGQTVSVASTEKNGVSTAAQSAVRTHARDGILVITLDDPDGKVNVLSERVSRALQGAFDELDRRSDVTAGVLISGKREGFIAGADVKMLEACRTVQEVQQLSEGMQEQLERLEHSKKPVVAAIHGACLGGGLEVALACHWRIATDDAKTQLALPEVMLGLVPGGGGTQRLPALVGLQAALDMMLTGKVIRAKKAKKMGLVDDVVVPFGLEDIAVAAAQRLAAGTLRRTEREPSPQDRALEETGPGRALLFRQARAQVMQKTLGLYPAPLAILDVVEAGISRGRKRGLEEEARRFGELAMTREARSLMHLFFGQTQCKKNRFGKPAVEVSTIGVLGAGLMGAGIAMVSAQRGHRVLLKDVSLEGLGRGKKQIWEELNKRTKRKAMTSFERDQTFARVVPQTDFRGFSHCDVVIEAVFEDLALKHRVLKELEPELHDGCVIASNTSALAIGRIADAAKRPENVVGMHYFSPVHKMPLLEVITTDRSSDRAAALAVDVGLKQGKTVIVVKDGPGFYTTRILAPFMDEAALVGLEGVDFHAFDALMKAFGFPVGPIALLDEVGLDVAGHVAKDLGPIFAARWGVRDTSALDQMIAQGFLGRKSGKGFFLYDGGISKGMRAAVEKATLSALGKSPKAKPINPGALAIFRGRGAEKTKVDATEIQNRMAMRMVNEAVACLQEGILANPVDGDIGAVFGLGFPPFLGGPFRYIDSQGAGQVAGVMQKLADRYGKRFEPVQLLVDHAKSGRRFHAEA